MNRDKEWFLKSLEGITLTDDYGNEFNGGYEEGLNTAYELALQLDEQGITQEQAWEVLAPRFSMTAIELEREVLDGFVAMMSEEIEMESDQIRKLADRIKKLHAENEELKAKLAEKEPKWIVMHNNLYLTTFDIFREENNNYISILDKKLAIEFSDLDKAEAVALLVNGQVKEVD